MRMPEKAPALSELAARVEYLERQNRLLKRAMAVLFALVGIALILFQVGFRSRKEDPRTPPDGSNKPGIVEPKDKPASPGD
jgi:hypothetical protein